ncbi:hypothetical protein GE300_00625 [Rhodobacteraceae bacterium 2CG4]|uniref:Uncharacterized protein n=1 Tax=Halovulum marinum TaxID=2662447 RepID=A0A6L5YUL0_9RHOB|nr:hypothetical protein [Halovulum marinum]MSU88116.1 hypothetical protein [Halovulum marinum]
MSTAVSTPDNVHQLSRLAREAIDQAEAAERLHRRTRGRRALLRGLMLSGIAAGLVLPLVQALLAA